MKRSFIFVCIVLLNSFFSNSWAQKKEIIVETKQEVIVKIKAVVTKDNQKLKDATAVLLLNNNKVKTVVTNKDGQFNLELELQKDYIIQISKKGLSPQKVKVSTHVPDKKLKGDTWWSCKVNINLLESVEGLDVSALNDPVAQISYVEKDDDFKLDEAYAKTMKVKIDDLAARIVDTKKALSEKKILGGDKMYGARKYEEAWLLFSKAKELTPKDEKVNEKLLKVKKQIKVSDEEGYRKAIEKAEKFQKEKNIESARTYYEIALLYKENDTAALNILEDLEAGKGQVTADVVKETGDGEKKLDKAEEETIIKKIDTYKRQLKVLEKENNKRSIASILDSIGNLYVKQNVKEEAIRFFDDAIKVKEEVGEKKDVAKILGKEAKLFLEMGQYDNSILAYEKALKLNEEMKNKEEVVSILGNMANIYNYTLRTDDALRAYEKLAAINSDAGDKEKTSDAYSNMGDIYLAKQDAEKAIDNYNKSLKLDIDLKDKKGQASSYNNLGVVFHKKGDYKKSIENHEKALVLFQELNEKGGLSKTYNNLGNNYYKMEETPKAFEYYEKALKINRELKDDRGEAIALFNLGNMYKEQNDNKKALDNYTKSIEVAKRINYQEALGKNYRAISGIYYEQKEYQKAFDNYKLYVDAKFVEDSEEQIAEIQTKVSSDLEIRNLQKKLSEQTLLSKLKDEKAKKDLDLKEMELQKKEAEVKKQRILIISFIVGFVIIAFFLILIFRQNKQIKKANRLLEQKNEEIMQQKEEITSQRDQLEVVNIELEKLSIVARETDNAVMIMDGRGYFEWVNAGFERLFGITLEQLKAEKGDNFIETSSSTDAKDLFQACIEEKITVNYDTYTFNAKGEKIWTQTTLTPIVDADGIVIKLVAIDSDITQVKLAEAEIKQQNEEIKAQSEQLRITFNQLEIRNNQILDSINYAKRIQEAILPRHSIIKQFIPDSFILFKPKDVVSGDFYWFSHQGDKIFIAAVDCTGHGVPGAFMSMIGNTLLNEIVVNKEIFTPSVILAELNKGISFSLTQGKEGEDTQDDGMDISICCIDNANKTITLALAGHTAYIVKENIITPIEGDVYSIGGMFSNKPGISYTDHIFNIDGKIAVYMCSDGYQDQFGGPNNKKFMASRMSKMFLENNNLMMEEQKSILGAAVEEWKGSRKQLDDILVVGLRFIPESMV